MSEQSILGPADDSCSFAVLYTARAIALAARLGALFIGNVSGLTPAICAGVSES